VSAYKAGSAEFGSIGAKYGAKTVTQTTAQMPSHTHIQDAHSHSTNTGEGYGAARDTPFGGGDGYKANYYTPGLVINATTATNQYAGGGSAMNNVQPTVAALMCIKT